MAGDCNSIDYAAVLSNYSFAKASSSINCLWSLNINRIRKILVKYITLIAKEAPSFQI